MCCLGCPAADALGSDLPSCHSNQSTVCAQTQAGGQWGGEQPQSHDLDVLCGRLVKRPRIGLTRASALLSQALHPSSVQLQPNAACWPHAQLAPCAEDAQQLLSKLKAQQPQEAQQHMQWKPQRRQQPTALSADMWLDAANELEAQVWFILALVMLEGQLCCTRSVYQQAG